MTANTTLATAGLVTMLAFAAVVPAAHAQGQGQGPVASACAAEIAKLCAGKEHGGGAVRACLEDNRSKVSDACRNALDTTGPGRGMGRRMQQGM